MKSRSCNTVKGEVEWCCSTDQLSRSSSKLHVDGTLWLAWWVGVSILTLCDKSRTARLHRQMNSKVATPAPSHKQRKEQISLARYKKMSYRMKWTGKAYIIVFQQNMWFVLLHLETDKHSVGWRWQCFLHHFQNKMWHTIFPFLPQSESVPSGWQSLQYWLIHILVVTHKFAEKCKEQFTAHLMQSKRHNAFTWTPVWVEFAPVRYTVKRKRINVHAGPHQIWNRKCNTSTSRVFTRKEGKIYWMAAMGKKKKKGLWITTERAKTK